MRKKSLIATQAEPLAAPRTTAQTLGASNDATARLVSLTLVTVAVVMPLPTLRLTPVLQLLSPLYQGVRRAVLCDQRVSTQAQRPADGFQEPRWTREGRRGGLGRD